MKIKPLVWSAFYPEEEGGFYHADDGAYRVRQDRFLGHWECRRLDKRIEGCFKSADDAMAAGQRDFVVRIASAVFNPADVDRIDLLEGFTIIPVEPTSEEWEEIKYTVDRKADPDIPMWRIKNVVSAARYVAGGRARRLLEDRLNDREHREQCNVESF